MDQIYPAKDFSKEDELEFEWCEGTCSEAFVIARYKEIHMSSLYSVSFFIFICQLLIV
jgi:hypothetical protein